jgi:hypothetical protein
MSKSSTKSSSTSNTNSTTTPTVAPWLNQGYQDYSGLINKFATSDPASFVASANPTQTQAFEAAQNLGGWKSGLDSASQLVRGAVNQPVATAEAGMASAASINQDDIDKFLNPYLSTVVDTTLNDYDVNSGRVRAAQDAQAAKNRAFGGSNFAVREAQTEGELARGRSAADANLRSGAYNTALDYANREADRRQTANLTNYQGGLQTNMFNAGQKNAGLDRALTGASLLGGFATQSGDSSRADLNSMLTSGQQQYAIDQAQKSALPDWLAQIGSLYGSIPIGSFTTLNQTGTGQSTGKQSSTSVGISDVAKAAQMAAMFSDVRLKDNIVFTHQDESGRKWYDYNYVWEPGVTHNGVLAQEIITTDPEAVFMDESGFYKVDYGSLR